MYQIIGNLRIVDRCTLQDDDRKIEFVLNFFLIGPFLLWTHAPFQNWAYASISVKSYQASAKRTAASSGEMKNGFARGHMPTCDPSTDDLKSFHVGLDKIALYNLFCTEIMLNISWY